MSGPTAVMFFYVISGYLISLVLKAKYARTADGTRRFYTSRFVRIFSLYWPLYIFAMVFDIWQARETITGLLDVLTGALLLGSDWSVAFSSYPELHFQALPNTLAVAWTLGAELTFYLLAPFLLRSKSASIAVLVISFGLRIIIHALVGFSNSWSYMFFPATIGFFLLGHFARVAYDRYAIPSILGWGFLFLSIICSLPNRFIESWETPYFYSSVVLFALAVGGIAKGTARRGWLTKVGEISYPLYLVHPMLLYFLFLYSGPNAKTLINYVIDWSKRQNLDPANVVATLVILAALATATVVLYLVERPAAQLMRRFIRTSARSPRAVGVSNQPLAAPE